MSWTRHQHLRWPRLLAGALVTAALIAACGGGGVDTGGTGAPVTAYSSGRISGFGSIVVNGVHYEESDAVIVDDEDKRRSADDLKLGMTVEIEAGDITADSNGRARSAASRVQFGSHISGPVESVDAAAGTLRVLGQSVDVDVNTVIDGFAGGLQDVTVSDLVEVFAFFDPSTGRYAATRLEPAGTLVAYKLRGAIAQLNSVAKTFAIGDALISYAGVDDSRLPQLANGTLARVKLGTAQEGGAWIATEVHIALPALVEQVKAEVDGYITDLVSLANFQVNGVHVDASGADVKFRAGTASQLANGVRVEVEGRVQDGVLVAETVFVRKLPPGTSGGGDDVPEDFSVEGTVGASDAAGASFVVRGVRVVFDADTQFEGGTSADLANGTAVVVTGVLQDGKQLRAKHIKLNG